MNRSGLPLSSFPAILALIALCNVLPTLGHCQPSVSISWRAEEIVPNLPRISDHASAFLMIDGISRVEDCKFAFDWVAGDPNAAVRVRVGWRLGDRPDESWLYAIRALDESGQPMDYRCEVKGWFERSGEQVRVYIPLECEGLEESSSLWLLLARLAVKADGKWTDITPENAHLSVNPMGEFPPPVVKVLDPPRIHAASHGNHTLYVIGQRMDPVTAVRFTSNETPDAWLPTRLEHVSGTLLRLTLPDHERRGVWDLEFRDAIGRYVKTSTRLTNAIALTEVRNTEGEIVPGALDIRPETAEQGVLIVDLRESAILWPEGRENDVLPPEELFASPGTRDFLNELQVRTLQRVSGADHEDRKPDMYRLTVPPEIDLADAVSKLRQNGNVFSADVSHRVELLATPNDPHFSSVYHWNLNPAINALHINAVAAWDRTVGSSSVKLAIMDTGLDHTHPDLGAGVGPGYPVGGGWNYVYNNSNFGEPPYSPAAIRNHGTRVTGIAAAITNNGIGVSGVAGGWASTLGCTLYGIRISDDSSNTNAMTVSLGIAGATSTFGAQVLNGSVGFYPYDLGLRRAVADSYEAGTTQIYGRGNGGDPVPFYPASFWPEFTIAAGGYRNDGTEYEHDYGPDISVCAPANLLATTDANNQYYLGFGGTSGAAPQVSGLAVLLRARAAELPTIPPLAPEDVKWLIQRGAWDMGDTTGYDSIWGWGRINADSSLRFLEEPWRLLHRSAIGGTVVESVLLEPGSMFSCDDLYEVQIPWGEDYYVTGFRYKVRCNVTYPPLQGSPYGPYVWGRGEPSVTVGYSAAMPNYCTSYTRVVPGSETTTGCQLETYIYRLWSVPHHYYLGYYPSTAENVEFAYTVLGVPASGVGVPESGEEIAVEPMVSIEPNPFASTARIRFAMNSQGRTQVSIFNVAGRKVKTWSVEQDVVVTSWDGRDDQGKQVPAGVFFFEIKRGDQSIIKKAVRVR